VCGCAVVDVRRLSLFLLCALTDRPPWGQAPSSPSGNSDSGASTLPASNNQIDVIAGKIQESYGITKDDAEVQINDWQKRMKELNNNQ